jgi:DNA polymerase I-like protein with 3'-5' exonuclease and polymerase domains
MPETALLNQVPPGLTPLVISSLKPPMNITHVVDGVGLEKLDRCVKRIAASPQVVFGSVRQPICGLDTETNFVHDFWFRQVRTLQFGDKDEQFVIDLLAFAETSERLIASQGLYGRNNGKIYEPIFTRLAPVLCSGQWLKVGQNLSFEYEVLRWNFGQRIWRLYSTDLAERVIQAGNISLKKYKEFSMQSIMARHFRVWVSKEEQKGFALDGPLTQDQIEYAALDIRTPLAMRQKQLEILSRDHLYGTACIENDALGTYVDMHLVGQRLNHERWLSRLEKVKAARVEDLKELDAGFIPHVGKKNEAINYEELNRLEFIWRNNFEAKTQEETDKATAIRLEKNKEKKEALREQLDKLKKKRAEQKAEARAAYSELSKDRTKKLKIIEKCEGEAFLNYGSRPQLLNALKMLPGMKNIQDTTDDTLLHFNDRPLIKALRRYNKGKKDTGTYGAQWTQRWVDKPSTKIGWLHPGDGRLHCKFNQLEAETGRSSSSQPNAMNLPKDDEVRACFIADPPDAEEPDGYVIVTVDMSGAELRIIAELAKAQSWIVAFAKGQDVHSVSTEILYPEKWPSLTVKSLLKPNGWTLEECKTEKVPVFNADGTPYMKKNKKDVLEHVHVPPCAYYALNASGELARQKCACPEHVELRNGTKATNFLLCYGGGPDALADELGVTVDAAKELMELHESKFPDVWGFLYRSGEAAKANKESRDMFGRRRLFPDPDRNRCIEYVIDEMAERIELPDEEQEANIFNFKARELREPTEDEMFALTHYPVGHSVFEKQIRWAWRSLMGSIGRKGKNHRIQGTNASIIKRAMGCGFDKQGKPYLWHTLPQFKARIQNMVHDELVVQCPKRFGQQVADLVGDAFKRAAAEVMTQVVMEHEAHIADRWMK